MKYDLECRYDARQSFYGKAKVEEKKIISVKVIYYIVMGH